MTLVLRFSFFFFLIYFALFLIRNSFAVAHSLFLVLFSCIKLVFAQQNYLNQIGNVSRHFLNSCVVELFNILQNSSIIICDEVDRNALATETTTATDSTGEKEQGFK